MTINASTLRKLAALNLSSEQMTGVLDLIAGMSEDEEARKAAQRERTRRARDKQRNATVTLQGSDKQRDDTRGGVTRVEDKTSNLEIEPQTENKTRERALASVEFEEWYAGYPHKVQRGAAERAFSKARLLASLSELKAGVRRYVASKPPDRHWQNPATWLNGKGWLDQPGVVVPMARASPVRPIDSLINSLVAEMDGADANTAAEIEGNSEAPRRLSQH